MGDNTPVHGWVVLDKPEGITSAHAVNLLKHALPKKTKIGHAGTLDPFASGVLPIAIGEATKTVTFMMEGVKDYAFTAVWGSERDTDDRDGVATTTSPLRPTPDGISALLPDFIGHIQQQPPSYSAIKVAGQRAYDMARAGEDVALAARQVRVECLTVAGHAFDGDSLRSTRFLLTCGKGTYVRSIARDLGRRLACFAYVSELRRTRVGKFDEGTAISLDSAREMLYERAFEELVQPVASVLDDIPAIQVTEPEAQRVKHGQPLQVPHRPAIEACVRIMRGDTLVAIGDVRAGAFHSSRVFNL